MYWLAVHSYQGRVQHSSARPDKHYGETCQQGVIQSGLRQNFNYNLEGSFRAYGQRDSAKAYIFIIQQEERPMGLWNCQLHYIILNDN